MLLGMQKVDLSNSRNIVDDANPAIYNDGYPGTMNGPHSAK